MIDRIDVGANRIDIHFRPTRLAALLDVTATPLPSATDDEIQLLSIPVRLRRFGREIKMRIDGTDPFVTAKPPRRSSMGFVPENQVRTRLHAGGNRIRTVGSAGEVPDASCVRCPLCWHPLPLQKPKERTLVGPAEALPTGRHHPGMAGDIILERRARSNRNAERDHHGFASDFPRNPQACPSGARCSAGSAGKRWRGTFRRRAMMRRS